MKILVDNVAAQVIEACLLATLSDTLSPTLILEMNAATVTAIAAEPEESQAEREQLTRKLGILYSGLDICKRYAGRSVLAPLATDGYHGGGSTSNPASPSINGDLQAKSEAHSSMSKLSVVESLPILDGEADAEGPHRKAPYD